MSIDILSDVSPVPMPLWTPPLQTGDRLTRAEFERRYQAMPPQTRAELIEGVVYLMASPVNWSDHSTPHIKIATWLGVFISQTPGTDAGDNATIRLDAESEPQPDACLRIDQDCGGQSRLVAGYVEGAPELAVEVSASSVSYDLHDKRNAYRRNGVREYLVWRVWDRAIDWFVLREGRYDRLAPDADGCYRSEVFPGLWLDSKALLRNDLARVLAVLQQGLASSEHAAFVADLASRKTST